MFTRFKRSSTVVFLDPLQSGIKEYERGKKLSIILSPSLYWVQKLSLPVKYVSEVKKLLPSIFEESLPEGDYSYSAYKNGDDFFVFAYEDKKILELIHKNNIVITDISSIHFAQSEFLDLQKAIKINTTQSLYSKNEIVSLAPLTWFDESEELDVSDLKLSKHTIKIQQYGHLVKSSSLYKIAALLSALIIIIFIESFITSAKIEKISEAKDELFSKYKLQSTLLQNKSLQSKYKKIYKKQSKLREYISYFLSMHLLETQKLTLIDYRNSILSVSIRGVNERNKTNILELLAKKKIKFQESIKANVLKVEMKL